MKNGYWLIIALVLVLGGCHQPKHGQTSDPEVFKGGIIRVQGTKFVDSRGRQIILSGFNYVEKNPVVNYILKDSAELFSQFNKWGINCLRLGLIWDGVEPEAGKYDENYLDQIEKKVKLAAEHQI